jgi:hypothetical protein
VIKACGLGAAGLGAVPPTGSIVMLFPVCVRVMLASHNVGVSDLF